MADRELLNRSVVALLGIPLAAFVVYEGGWALVAVIGLLAALGAREFYTIAEKTDQKPLTVVGMLVSAGFVVLAGWSNSFSQFASGSFILIILAFLLLLAAVIWLRWPDGAPLGAISVTLAGALYSGGALAFLVLLRNLPESSGVFPPPRPSDGAFLVAFPVAVTWFGDSAAYFGGRAFGRKKLIPAVSPGKTWAGSISGVIASTLSGGLLAYFFLVTVRYVSVDPLTGAILGLVLGMAGQVGDLAESVLKREAGVKDSGRFLPGHGGVLDRIDSLVFAVPLAYLILLYLGPAS